MKIYILGSCSGTEPMPDRHHTAWVLEVNGRLLWFDAGEGCAYTAHMMGLDLLSVSDIFISHPHMDHIGGLPHLLWTIRKLYTRTKNLPRFGDISVYVASQISFEGVMNMLYQSEGGYSAPYQTLYRKICDGVILNSGEIVVAAKHNLHIKPIKDEYLSFSFVIEAEDKRIVYTGDLASQEELVELIADGCDVLLCESGHHDPLELVQLFQKCKIGQIYFLHHGRKILYNYDALLAECRAVLPNVTFCNDQDVFDI